MSAHVSASRQVQSDSDSGLIKLIISIGLIGFGLWFGSNVTIEFLHNRLYDPNVAIEAEMEYLQRKMNCAPGEVLEIRPLGNHGAKSVKCVPGGNMPARGGTRG